MLLLAERLVFWVDAQPQSPGWQVQNGPSAPDHLGLALSTEVSNTPYLTFNQVPFPPLFCLPGLFLPSGFSIYPCGLSGLSLTDQWWNTYFVPVFSKEMDEVWRSESQDLLLRPDRTPEGSQLPSPTHISWACTLVCKSPMGQINNA